MAIPIPSNLPVNTVVDFHRNDLISPPSAPAVVESLAAIDPRVALSLAMPVGNSSAGGSLQDALQNQLNKSALNGGLLAEPTVDQAVLLELSSSTVDVAGNQNQTNSQINSLLSQSLSRLDSAGSAALGQLLSDILAVDVPELGQVVKTGQNSSVTQNVVVSWPGSITQNANLALANPPDPKMAMTMLYQNLQNSGIFAADQLRKLFFSVGDDSGVSVSPGQVQTVAGKLLSQLTSDTPSVQDSVKLLLRGDLLWRGQLMPNVQGRIYREDAWEADPRVPARIQKGSKITMEVNLPNLGPLKVIGVQFGEDVHVSIETSSTTTEVLSNSFAGLLESMRSEVDPSAKISLKDGGANYG